MRILFFLIALMPSIVLAQVRSDVRPDAGRILKQESDIDRFNKETPKKIPKSLIEEKEKKSPIQPTNVKILVNSFKFEGDVKAFSISQLQSLLSDLNNRSLTFEEMQLAADRITNFYNEKGFFLAQAIIPKQEIKDGIIIILINEGKLDSKDPYKINKKNLRISEDKIKAYMNESLKENLLKDSVERGLLNISDNPGVYAKVNLEPGSEQGSTRIVLDVSEESLITGSVVLDNYGNRYTGDLRASASININDPNKIGDYINVLGTKAIEGDLELKKITYNFPLGVSGLRAESSYSVVDFKVGKELTSTKTEGKAEDINFNLKYPIYRSVEKSILTNFNYDKKYLYNEAANIVTSDKAVDNYNIGVTFQQKDQIFRGGFTQANFNFTRGDLNLSNSSSNLSSDQSAAGYKTHGTFKKENLQLTRIQSVTDKLNIHLNADAQFASKNLDSSEKMSLGGPSGVRAYPTGEASGDEGFKYSVDIKYNFGDNIFLENLLGSIFYDYGKIKQYKDSSISTSTVTNNQYSISGYGLSLDANLSIFSTKLIWAHTIGGNPGASSPLGNDSDGKNDSSRFFLLISSKF
jgi:hypothetical protein